ncbi:MAG: glycosyltransferase [Bacteroidota bacterium]|nr:glycosyltransferase [Bacteroidota bacterium]
MGKVAVVIPVYGQWHLVKKNVDALIYFDNEFINEIIIVDDCSPVVNPFHFNDVVTIIRNSSNLGYTATVNNGLRRAKSDVIILLDSDAYPIRAFINDVVSIYEKNSTVGCIGFGTVDDLGNNTGNFQYEPSVLGYVLGQKLQALFNLRLNNNIIPYSCAVSFRKVCLIEMEYFDENTFPVLDADIDLSMNIHRSQWKLIFDHKIIVSHKGGNSYKVNYKRVNLYHHSRWNLLRKHNQLQAPFFIKFLLNARVILEIFIFYSLKVLKYKKSNYSEKILGRRILLSEIKNYS